MKAMEKIEGITLTPFLVKLNYFINEFNAGKSAALRLTNDFRIVALLFPEQIDVQHLSLYASEIPPSTARQINSKNCNLERGRDRENALTCKNPKPESEIITLAKIRAEDQSGPTEPVLPWTNRIPTVGSHLYIGLQFNLKIKNKK